MAYTDKTDGSRTILEGHGATKVTLSGVVFVGDIIGNSSGTWVQADANNSIYGQLVAGSHGDTGDEITAYRSARVGNITTGTLGNRIYLSDTAGGTFVTASTTTTQDVGFELGNSEVWLEPVYTDVTGIVQDLTIVGELSLRNDLDMTTSGTGVYDITIKDNVADALSIVDNDSTPADYMVITTTTGGEKITFTPEIALTDDIDLTTSTTGTYDITLKDNQADALSIVDNDSTPKDYMVFNTSTGSERITFGSLITFSDDITHTAGQFITGSPQKLTVTSKNDNATLTTAEAGVILVTVDAKTMTLPAASGNAGLRYIIKQTAVHTTGVTIDGNASETIDGDTDPTSSATYDFMDIICDGSNWHVVAKQGTWS